MYADSVGNPYSYSAGYRALGLKAARKAQMAILLFLQATHSLSVLFPQKVRKSPLL